MKDRRRSMIRPPQQDYSYPHVISPKVMRAFHLVAIVIYIGAMIYMAQWYKAQ